MTRVYSIFIYEGDDNYADQMMAWTQILTGKKAATDNGFGPVINLDVEFIQNNLDNY